MLGIKVSRGVWILEKTLSFKVVRGEGRKENIVMEKVKFKGDEGSRDRVLKIRKDLFFDVVFWGFLFFKFYLEFSKCDRF